MRWSSFVVVLAVVMMSRSALAYDWATAEDDSSWVGQVSAGGTGEVDRAATSTPEQGVTHSGTETSGITGLLYLHPLVDDQNKSLSLLSFYQHPGEFSVSVGNATTFSDPSTGWTEENNALTATFRLQTFPWGDTGVVGFVGGQSGSDLNALSASYGLGVVHYFLPNLLGEVDYVGSASRMSVPNAGYFGTTSTDNLAATNAGRARVAAVLLDDRLSIDGHLQIGQATSTFTSVGTFAFSSGTTYTQGISYDLGATVTGYCGRQLSASLTGGLVGQSSTTQFIGLAGQPSGSDNVIGPLVGIGVQYFFTDPVSAKLTYTASFPTAKSGSNFQRDSTDQVVSLSVAARL